MGGKIWKRRVPNSRKCFKPRRNTNKHERGRRPNGGIVERALIPVYSCSFVAASHSGLFSRSFFNASTPPVLFGFNWTERS
jgi:hypothetical protein